MTLDAGLLVAYGAILVMAVVPIYLGSRASVDLIVTNAAGKHERRSDNGLDKETLSTTDAYWFPITGSCVLFGLYMLFKYLDKEHVNTLLTAYFAFLGFYALASVFADFVSPIESFMGLDRYNIALTHETTKSSKVKTAMLYTIKFTKLSLITAVLAALVTGLYVLTKHWILNNMFGFALSITAITLMDIDSFQTGMTLLTGLFVYDIFWVFGTDVMVTVAKSFDAPVKLLFPKTLDNLIMAKTGFTMLGLGDIVLPGIYIALSLRYDYHNYLTGLDKQKKRTTIKFTDSFATPYFTTGFVAYVAGLATTVWVMHTFQAAQPALLYLSPACIFSTLLVALVRGELGAMFSYSSTSDNELKEKLLGTPSKKNNNNKAKHIAKSAEGTTSSPTDQISSDDDKESESEDNAVHRRHPRKLVGASSPRKVTGSSKKNDGGARSSNRDASAVESAEAAAERKRKRREAERFDFEEQTVAPVTKRVHAADINGAEEDGNSNAESVSLPSAPRSRNNTRDLTSGDEAVTPATTGKKSKKSKKGSNAATTSSGATSAPSVFTDAVAGTGVGKSAAGNNKKNNGGSTSSSSTNNGNKKDKSSGNNNNNTSGSQTQKRSGSSARTPSPTRTIDTGANNTGDDDEFMVVSRKGRKGKSRGNAANLSGSMDNENTTASPPASSKAAGKQASVSDDLARAMLANPADWGL